MGPAWTSRGGESGSRLKGEAKQLGRRKALAGRRITVVLHQKEKTIEEKKGNYKRGKKILEARRNSTTPIIRDILGN